MTAGRRPGSLAASAAGGLLDLPARRSTPGWTTCCDPAWCWSSVRWRPAFGGLACCSTGHGDVNRAGAERLLSSFLR